MAHIFVVQLDIPAEHEAGDHMSVLDKASVTSVLTRFNSALQPRE
jgi:hypothetical protein